MKKFSIFNFQFSIFKKGRALHRSSTGFTLVELLLYMGILSILLLVLTGIFSEALDVQLESQSSSSITQDRSYILAKLAYDVHRATSIIVPASQGATLNSLQLKINDVNYTYSTDVDGNLILTNELGTNNLNNYNSSISGLVVQRLGNTGKVEDTLKISLTITSRLKRAFGYETKNLETNLSLRRK